MTWESSHYAVDFKFCLVVLESSQEEFIAYENYTAMDKFSRLSRERAMDAYLIKRS